MIVNSFYRADPINHHVFVEENKAYVITKEAKQRIRKHLTEIVCLKNR